MIVKVDPSTTISESPLVALKVKLSPSTSLADNSTVRNPSSSIVWLSSVAITGASLTGVTVNVKLPEPEPWPSLAITLTTISPL